MEEQISILEDVTDIYNYGREEINQLVARQMSIIENSMSKDDGYILNNTFKELVDKVTKITDDINKVINEENSENTTENTTKKQIGMVKKTRNQLSKLSPLYLIKKLSSSGEEINKQKVSVVDRISLGDIKKQKLSELNVLRNELVGLFKQIQDKIDKTKNETEELDGYANSLKELHTSGNNMLNQLRVYISSLESEKTNNEIEEAEKISKINQYKRVENHFIERLNDISSIYRNYLENKERSMILVSVYLEQQTYVRRLIDREMNNLATSLNTSVNIAQVSINNEMLKYVGDNVDKSILESSKSLYESIQNSQSMLLSSKIETKKRISEYHKKSVQLLQTNDVKIAQANALELERTNVLISEMEENSLFEKAGAKTLRLENPSITPKK